MKSAFILQFFLFCFVNAFTQNSGDSLKINISEQNLTDSIQKPTDTIEYKSDSLRSTEVISSDTITNEVAQKSNSIDFTNTDFLKKWIVIGNEMFKTYYEGKIIPDLQNKRIKYIEKNAFLQFQLVKKDSVYFMEIKERKNIPQIHLSLNNKKIKSDSIVRGFFITHWDKIIRSGGFCVEERISNLYKEEDTRHLKAELDTLSKYPSVSLYFAFILQNDTFPKNLKESLLKKSHYYLPQIELWKQTILNSVCAILEHDDLSKAFIQQTLLFEEDYTRAEILQKTIDKNNLKRKQTLKILYAISQISQDYYRAWLLDQIAIIQWESDIEEKKYLELLSGFTDDFHTYTLINHRLERQFIPPETLQKILLIGQSIRKDIFKAEILKTAYKQIDIKNTEMFKFYLNTVNTIKTDQVKGETFQYIISETSVFTQSSLLLFIQNIKTIHSDYQKTKTLLSVSKKMDKNDMLAKEAYLNIAQTIYSGYYRNLAIDAIY